MTDPAPIHVHSPIWLPPHIVAPDATCTKSLIITSWPIDDFVFSMQCLPIFAEDCTIAPCTITVPSPIGTFRQIIELGCIAFKYLFTLIFSAIFFRTEQLPIVIIALSYSIPAFDNGNPMNIFSTGASSTICSAFNPFDSSISRTTLQCPPAP